MHRQPLKYIALASVLFLSACDSDTENNNEKNTAEISDTLLSTSVTSHAGDFADWATQYDIKMPANSEISSEGILKFIPDTTRLDDEFYKNYGKLLVYNPDSTRFIDFLSYNIIIDEDKNGNMTARSGEADQEIKVYDTKTNTGKRVFYLGTCCRVQKAFWYSADIIGLIGMASPGANQYYMPVIWFINITNGSLYTYELKKDIEAQEPADLMKQTIESKGITWMN